MTDLVDETVSIYGSYETRDALVSDIRLAILAILREVDDPSPHRIAELVTDEVIVPLLKEFHQ
jgi:predicted nucleotidyltransferase